MKKSVKKSLTKSKRFKKYIGVRCLFEIKIKSTGQIAVGTFGDYNYFYKHNSTELKKSGAKKGMFGVHTTGLERTFVMAFPEDIASVKEYKRSF